MDLFNYDKVFLSKRAEELGFVRDTLEKILRLADVLEYLNQNPILKASLALKGGTAINLTIFNLPRLSVDIDLDYLMNNSKEEMLKGREIIHTLIDRYMTSQGYFMDSRSKNFHSLDSWVYHYLGVSGNRDNIKIEINYSLRSHLLEPKERPIITADLSKDYRVKVLDPIEIFGSKITALLRRAAARDLYDVSNMIRYNLFDNSELELLKKCVIFYNAISSKGADTSFDPVLIDSITQRKIKTDLLPVIKRSDDFNLESAKKIVKQFVSELMILTDKEKSFLDKFSQKAYLPELLFEDKMILNRIKKHPMAVWKTQ